MDDRSEYHKEWYQKHRTRILAQQKLYDAAHILDKQMRGRVHYFANREAVIRRTNAHTAAHRERYNGYLRKYRARKKRWLKEYLATHPCVDCGIDDPDVLEFDHVRGTKDFTIGDAPAGRLERIQAEVAKCDVRCCNCHRKRHRRETWNRSD